MTRDQDEARIAADSLLTELIRHQPGLFEMGTLDGRHGKALGQAIAELRLELIEMYKTQP